MQKSQTPSAVTTFIMATWRQWTFSLGLIMILVALSPFVSRFFIPYVAFAFAFILGVRVYLDHSKPNRGLALPYICTITLLLTGVLITAFNITDRITGIYELAGHPFNEEMPQIVQLAVAPMLAVTSGLFMLRRLGRGKSYRTKSGQSVMSLVQRIVWQETRYQTRLLFWITTVISIADWTYCVYSFSSVSLNKPDRFFFIWMPMIVYFLSLIYIGFRCFSVWALYSQANPDSLIGASRSSIIRYLIVHENSLYLSRHRLEVKQHASDDYATPVRLKFAEADRLSGNSAERLFCV
ncbi:MAG: hypothetical protein K2G40_01955, partial [Muribaculaceae bacterium]|nr:hypothetical protein [Muribaculaceae bacterium]